MKKLYITPALEVTLIATETLIAESLEKGSGTITNSNDILVKGQGRTDDNNYNVWDDDWSK